MPVPPALGPLNKYDSRPLQANQASNLPRTSSLFFHSLYRAHQGPKAVHCAMHDFTNPSTHPSRLVPGAVGASAEVSRNVVRGDGLSVSHMRNENKITVLLVTTHGHLLFFQGGGEGVRGNASKRVVSTTKSGPRGRIKY